MLFDEACDCSCHNDFGHSVHIVACCYTCTYCQRKITVHAFDKHQVKCEDKFDPKINSIRVSELLKALDTLKKADLDVSNVDEQIVKLLSRIFSEQ